jgi:predicted HD superfamily hydrolase involved in NAD metabolism
MELEVLLKTKLTAKRYAHSLAVAKLAQSLAPRAGVEPQQAWQAGLLHDCAHDLSPEVLLRKCEEFGILVGSMERKLPFLLHGPVGAELARRDYGVGDPQILDAICFHTTGKPGMSRLARLISLADYLEPGRTFPGVERLRTIAGKNLDLALLAAYDSTIGHLLASRKLVHPQTILTRNWLLELSKEVSG